MSYRIAVAVFCVCATAASPVRAQLSVAVQMDPNPSPYISDWRSNPNTIRLIVTNPTRGAITARVDGSIRGDARGRVAETRLDAGVPPVSIPPGTSTLNAFDAHVLEEGAVRYVGPTQNETMQSGRLPEDRYQLCIRLVAYDAPHSALSPEMCAAFQIDLLQPPDLIQPQHNTALESPPTFQWTMVPTKTGKLMRYELKLIELEQGQTNLASALQSNPPLFVREIGIPVYQYLPSDPQLQKGHRYAWCIRAFDAENRATFANAGRSQIHVFTFGSSKTVADKGLVTAHPPVEVAKHPPRPDTLVAGTFTIVVEAWDDSSISVAKTLPSGTGSIRFSCGSTMYRQKKGLNFGKTKEAGLRVRFRDVHWIGPFTTRVVLDQGVATYPTHPASPAPPAAVPIDSGFTLLIDSLVITPTDAIVKGSIALPENIISADQCTLARLGLPPTKITSHCDLFQIVPDSAYGPLYAGETDIAVHGKGYIVDFSTTQSPPGFTPPLLNAWKGVVLTQGGTPVAKEPVISNRGYTQAGYTYTNALITTAGLDATLRPVAPFTFRTLDPYGYDVELKGDPTSDWLHISRSEVADGRFFAGSIVMPVRAVRNEKDKPLRVSYDSMFVQSDMDLFAQILLPGGSTLTWGALANPAEARKYYELYTTKEVAGQFYLAARVMKPYFPVVDTGFVQPNVVTTSSSAEVENERRQGVSLKSTYSFTLRIRTKDTPDTVTALVFDPKISKRFWMNVASDGVHAEIKIFNETGFEMDLGPTWSTGAYFGGAPFHLLFSDAKKQSGAVMTTRFVSSAVWDADWRGTIAFLYPILDTIPFKRLMFTSTADCAGGQLDLKKPANLEAWGVKLVAKDSTKSAGTVCVKLGVVYLTAAGFHEPVHFSKPFNLIWGEMKAAGSLGRLYFDCNNVGQTFDHFPYTPSFVGLSDPATGGRYVQTCGSVSVSYFGAKQMSITDHVHVDSTAPYHGRSISLEDALKCGCKENELHWARDWAGGLGALDFTMAYDEKSQEGFIGTGTASLLGVTGAMSATLVTRAGRSSVCITDPGSHTISLAAVEGFANVAKVWGCGSIVGESLECFVVGGELESSASANSGLTARTGAIVSVKLAMRPGWTRFTASGDIFLSLGSGLGDLEASGYIDLLHDRHTGSCSGTLRGSITTQSIMGGLTGEGDFEWTFGTAYESVQGRVSVGLFGMLSAGAECGLFIGIQAPKEKAWVLDDMDGHFGVNKKGLPGKLTGFYGYLSYSAAVNLYIISGGYKVYAGLGAFVDFGSSESLNGGLGVLGNVGVHVWGEMLAGFASVEAWGNLQMIAGIPPTPPSFDGSLGMRACVLWYLCKSISVHCGFNLIDGFYLN